MSEQPGMVPREEWEQTVAHQASTYACNKCGQKFATPHDVYDHLDVVHPKKPKPGSKKKAA